MLARPAQSERLVGRAALDHEHADARAAVIVESRVREPPTRCSATPRCSRCARAARTSPSRRGRAPLASMRAAAARASSAHSSGLKRTAGVGEIVVARRHRATIPSGAPVCSGVSRGASWTGHPALLQLHVDQARACLRAGAHGARRGRRAVRDGPPPHPAERDELVAKTGQNMLPVIEFADGHTYREESKDMAARIAAGKLDES